MSQQEGKPKFWAFVSYSHHDKRVAHRLYTALNEAKVPAQYRSTTASAAKTFSPIFIDDRETAASSTLSFELQRALEESSALIVVCSPFAVASLYVNQEIQYFQSLGRSERIFCLLASGVPNAADIGDAALECFPAALRRTSHGDPIELQRRPLAAPLGEERPAEWRKAVEQLSAALVGISLGDLSRLRRGAQALRVVAAATLVGAAAGAIYAAAWAYAMPHATYGRDYVYRWGVPAAVGPLTEGETKRRPWSVRIIQRGAYGRVERFEAVNQEGNCPSSGLISVTGDSLDFCNDIRACGYRYSYDAKGLLARAQAVDQNGRTVETLTFDNPSRAVVSEAVLGCSRAKTGIQIVEFNRHEAGPLAGLDIDRRFFGGPDRKPRANSQRAFGLAYDYDRDGRVIKISALGQHGPTVFDTGYYASLRQRDAHGQVSQSVYLDAAGNHVNGTDGLGGVAYVLDRMGNALRTTNLDVHLQPTADARGKVSTVRRFDEHGHELESMSIGADGKPAPDLTGISIYRFGWDANGYLSERMFADGAGNPAMNKDGCYGYLTEYSRLGVLQAERCADGAKRPKLSNSGVHLTRYESNPRGDRASVTNFGVKDEPVRASDTLIHKQVYLYDEDGRMKGCRDYDDKGQLTRQKDGEAGYDMTYDDRGRLIARAYIGPDGQPTVTTSGVAKESITPDEFGRESQLIYLGTDGKPLIDGSAMVAGHAWERDVFGRVIRETNLGVDGGPMNGPNGVASVIVGYSDRGQRSRRAFYDANRSPAAVGGAFVIEDVYDPSGRLAKLQRLGVDGKPPGAGAIATEVYFYDSLGNKIEQKLLDAQGQLLRTTLPAITRWKYDSHRRIVAVRVFNADSAPMNDINGVHGSNTTYDAGGNVIEFGYVGIDDRPAHRSAFEERVATYRYTYDERRRVFREQYFDEDAKPVRDASGAFGWLNYYSGRDQIVEEVALGADGLAGTTDEGWSIRVNIYDVNGWKVETRFLQADRQLVSGQRSISRIRRDAYGREVENQFLGADGRLLAAPQSGRAIVRKSYDASGHLTSETSFGADGKPVNRDDAGWHKMIWIWVQGELRGTECYLVEGEKVSCSARVNARQGQQREEAPRRATRGSNPS